MALFGFGSRQRKESAPPPETRSDSAPAAEVVSVSGDEVLRIFGLDGAGTAGEVVTVESALGVPAVWAAVNFLSATIAGLPLKVFKKGEKGPEAAGDHPLSEILNGVSNDEDLQSAFDLRKWMMEQTLTGGRGMCFIDREAGDKGTIRNLWPMEPAGVTVSRADRRKSYRLKEGKRVVTYAAAEVIDIPFMLKANGVSHRSPILSNKTVIGLAQAVTKWGARYFEGGGVPPFAVTGNFQSGRSMTQAADDLDEAVRKTAKERRQALVLPAGLSITPIGTSAKDAQMIETQRFIIEQISRIFSLPPVFLQDLTHGTFSNTEQQDLHLVKHTVSRWAKQIEKEMSLKFFGRGSEFYVEHVLDGLLRGDFKARMEGYARAIQSGVLIPNECRALENRPGIAGGDRGYIQGATVPLEQAGNQIGHNGGPPLETAPEGQEGKGDDA